MKFKVSYLPLLLAAFIRIHCDEQPFDAQKWCHDLELAAKMGSGESVTININATEGMEGQIAQIARDAIQETQEPTWWERVKSFFSSLFFQ